MNSDDEDRLFRECRWEKDLVQRRFRAPCGYEIDFETIVIATTAGGLAMEHRLVEVAQAHKRCVEGRCSAA